MKQLPKTITDLVLDQEKWMERDALNGILNQNPPDKWIKDHPIYKGVKYLPIDKHEYLLKRLFQQYRIEILREGTMFNSVYCTVRVHYVDPVSGSWTWQDGTGAQDVQTKAGSSPANMQDINHGAISRGLPTAESYAIKDACEKIGNIFGANLNRKDVMIYELSKQTVDYYMPESKKKDLAEIRQGLDQVFDIESLDLYFNQLDVKDKTDKDILKLFNDKKTALKR